MRTFGVEEELLLVDAGNWRPKPAAPDLLAALEPEEPHQSARLTSEFQQEQIEVVSRPWSNLQDLAEDIRTGRRLADHAALKAGARVAALATSPMPVDPHTTAEQRPLAIRSRFGLTAEEQLTCGLHVHVSVDSDDEGVAILDRIRPWLAVLAALSANSPFWNGRSTGYASFRTQAWTRWPATGPTDLFGSAEAYHRRVDDLIGAGVLLDRGMVYFDARLSYRYPTVEIRVADVCLEADDAVLLAALTRGLVETAGREWRTGIPPRQVSSAVLRLASWLGGKWGLDGELLHPVTAQPSPAAAAVAALVDHVRPALDDAGDSDTVGRLLMALQARGTGSRRQLRTMADTGRGADVVMDAVGVTNAD